MDSKQTRTNKRIASQIVLRNKFELCLRCSSSEFPIVTVHAEDFLDVYNKSIVLVMYTMNTMLYESYIAGDYFLVYK